MLVLIFLTFVDLFVFIFTILLVIRVFGSYIMKPTNSFYVGLINITEPLLVPVRRLLPPMAGIDLAPLVMFFLLQGIQYGLHALFQA